MVVYYLSSEVSFPDPKREDVDDLVAVGGDLSPQRLIFAYQKGIFPWYSEDTPILWWSPDPRLVLDLQNIHVPNRLKRILRQKIFKVTLNMNFSEVINSCAYVKRSGMRGTWIVPEMIEAYLRLYRLGFAHSVEAWRSGSLVGGLYGVAIGRMFFGESMFYRVSNASKVAFVHFVNMLKDQGFHFIDCQQTTQHLQRFGAHIISRKKFMNKLDTALRGEPPLKNVWTARELTGLEF